MRKHWRIPGWGAMAACLAVTACATFPTEGLAVEDTRHNGEIGIITDWVLAGPFPNPAMDTPAPDGSARAGWNIDYLEPIGGETNATLSIDQPIEVEIDGVTRTIQPRQFTAGYRGVVDLLAGLDINEEQGTEQVAYGYTSIEVERPATHHFLIGADDAAKLFVNGELLFAEWHHGRGITPAEYHVEVELEAGTHDVLLKVDNNSGPWAFSLEIYTDAGLEEFMRFQELGPADFPRVEFGGHERESEAWNRYTWHHFNNRLGNFNTLFLREYMTVADVWLANAREVSSGTPMQDVIRKWSDNTPVDPDGYVQSAQHFSHAHDGGWPFPLWPQVYGGHGGWTFGWHFQSNGGPGWVWEYNMIDRDSVYGGQTAADTWRLDGARCDGVGTRHWSLHLEDSMASLTTPDGLRIDAYNSPFIQIRWNRDGTPPRGSEPYLEWKREGDEDWSADRRMIVTDYPSEDNFTGVTRMRHAHIPLYTHPKWEGTIRAFRFVPAPGETGVDIRIDSIFTVYDTRKPYNNKLFVTGAWEYFRWTGDVGFLRDHVNRLRMALRYTQDSLNTLEFKHVRNTKHGHDGLAGWYVNEDGVKVPRPGHGIGNNYYDLLPFGWDDMYGTAQYYGALLAMANMEEAIARNPGWDIPRGSLAFDAEELRRHAAAVKDVANEKFWNPETGRFFGSFDREGRAYDFGFTFVTLEAIWYGIAREDRAREALDWISGRRIVDGDTSTGDDIYAFRFGPRATTLRNIEWYGQGWMYPENLEFGEQIQDGGAVLGMTFYDLYARLQVYGPDDAWERLLEIIEWDIEVTEAGGYRAYYEQKGIGLQGGGTAGGIGIDFEFLESSIPPAIVPYGFLGLDPRGDHLRISPRIPTALDHITLERFLFQEMEMNITASGDEVTLAVATSPIHPIRIHFPEEKTHDGATGHDFTISEAGTYIYTAP